MRTTLIKAILCLSIGLLPVPVFGQDILEAYQTAINKVFSGIPSEKVTTGILVERAPSFVDMSRYEGNKEIMDTCNVRKWKQMILQLNMAHLDSRKFNYDSRITEADYNEKVKTGDIPLGIIFYDYNRIDPEALSKGRLLIDETNGVLRDISSRNESALKTVTCFAASPMAEILQAGTYSFYLEPGLFVSNNQNIY